MKRNGKKSKRSLSGSERKEQNSKVMEFLAIIRKEILLQIWLTPLI